MRKRIRNIPCLRPMSRACSGPFTWRPENPFPLYGFTNPAHYAAERRNDRIMVRGTEADIKRSGGASTRRNLTPLSSCSTPAAESLSPACSKAPAFPAPATGLRVRVVISQALPILAAPNTRWPSAYAY
jgi:hypothetical protein